MGITCSGHSHPFPQAQPLGSSRIPLSPHPKWHPKNLLARNHRRLPSSRLAATFLGTLAFGAFTAILGYGFIFLPISILLNLFTAATIISIMMTRSLHSSPSTPPDSALHQRPPSSTARANVPTPPPSPINPRPPFKFRSEPRPSTLPNSRIATGAMLLALSYLVVGSMFASPQTRAPAAIFLLLLTLLAAFAATTLGYIPVSRIPRRLLYLLLIGTFALIWSSEFAHNINADLDRPAIYPSTISPPILRRDQIIDVDPSPDPTPDPFHPKIIPLTTSAAPTSPPDSSLQIKLDYAQKALDDAEAQQKVGRITSLDYIRAKAARDIAAAELADDPAKVADIKYQLADADYQSTPDRLPGRPHHLPRTRKSQTRPRPRRRRTAIRHFRARPRERTRPA